MNRQISAEELKEWIKEYRSAKTTGGRKIKLSGKWFPVSKAKHMIQHVQLTQHPHLNQLEIDFDGE